MEPKEQYEIYKMFCDLMHYYSKCLILSMAKNDLSRRYTSSVAKLSRYLVQTFAHLGVTDVHAHQAIDEKKR